MVSNNKITNFNFKGRDYIFNFFRYEKYKDLYLVTLDDASFRFFNKSAFLQIKRGKIEDEKLFGELRNFGLIIDEFNFKDIVKKNATRYSFVRNSPSLHIIVPTMRCNMACSYCFANANYMEEVTEHQVGEMDEKTAKKIVDFIFKTSSKAVTIEFQGGECLLRFDVMKIIVNYAKELNEYYCKDLRLTFVSNFTFLSNEMIEFFIGEDVSFCTSLDGPQIVHDKNRYFLKDDKKVGSYKIVRRNILRVNEAYKKFGKPNRRVNILPTISKFSLDYYKEIIDEYVDLEVDMFDIRFLINTGRSLTNSQIHYEYEQYREFVRKSFDYIKELRVKGVKISERMFDMYYSKIVKRLPAYHCDFESPCGGITGQLLYYPNGNIYTCNEGLGRDEFKVGNVFEDEFKDIFKKKESASFILNSMIESNPWCDKCVYKPYCGTCQVDNFYSFGKVDFYPTKTKRHFMTLEYSQKFFDYFYDEIMKNIDFESKNKG